MMTMLHQSAPPTAALWRLAKEVGIKPAFTDAAGQHVRAAPEALLRTLQCCGIDIASPQQAPQVMRDVQAANNQRVLEPVYVLWQQETTSLKVRNIPEHASGTCTVELESDGNIEWPLQVKSCGGDGAEVRLAAPTDLPVGYHRMHVEFSGQRHSAHLFVAPPAAYQRMDRAHRQQSGGRPGWGAFLPLYSLYSKRSWGVGDLTDLQQLAAWVQEQGGSMLGTLPLLASQLDDPAAVSPYTPVSRLFFNELYLDVTAVPELAHCEQAQAMITSTAFQAELAQLQQQPYVDHRQAMQHKRQVLELLADELFRSRSQRRDELSQFVQHRDSWQSYAAFRAAIEQMGPWRQWAQPQQDGRLEPSDYDPRVQRYHLYVQWLLHEQLQRTAESGADLYLDMPVGVSADGYDIWRHRDQFVDGANVGAPPDAFFTGGQDWGMRPMHPERSRLDGHRHFRASLQAHLRYAGALRIDHIMALHRLYWVPHGLSARQGVYVRYPAEELYAVLCIESHRARAEIIGENLGTVPAAVNSMMTRRGIAPLYVGQFSVTGRVDQPLQPPPAGSVASLNTHDTPTFAAYWRGDDIVQRHAMGLLTDDQVDVEQKNRKQFRMSMPDGHDPDDEQAAREAMLRLLSDLAGSDTGLVLINLEDVWLERRAQNVPGTINETNWRRKARYSLEQIVRSPQVREAVQAVAESTRSPNG